MLPGTRAQATSTAARILSPGRGHHNITFRSLYGFDPITIHVSDDPSASPAAEGCLDRMPAGHNDIHSTLMIREVGKVVKFGQGKII